MAGGIYALDDLEICKNYLQKVNEKNIPFIALSSNGKDIIAICKKYLFVKEVLIFCRNYDCNEYYIKDEVLREFLFKCPSITSKCIFYLSTQLILSDKDRNVICSIKWNSKIINEYLSSLNSTNFNPITIKEITLL